MERVVDNEAMVLRLGVNERAVGFDNAGMI